MGVFLRLCNTDLSHIVSRQILAESIVKQYFVECNQLVGDRLVIICEAYISKVQPFFALKSFEIIIAERSGNLTGAVRTEIEEYDRISILYNCHRFAVLLDHCGKHELVGLIIVIGRLNCLCGVGPLHAFAFCKSLICKLHTVPAVVSVHCIVTAGDHADLSHADLFHLRFQFFDVSLA